MRKIIILAAVVLLVLAGLYLYRSPTGERSAPLQQRLASQPDEQQKPQETKPPEDFQEAPRPDVRRLSESQEFIVSGFQDSIRRVHGILPPEKLDEASLIFLAIAEERLDLEVRMAKAGTISSGENLIEIPAYPEAGQALKLRLENALKDILGADLGQEEFSRLSRLIASSNAEWGKYKQTLLIGFNAAKGTYPYTHTVNPDPKNDWPNEVSGELLPPTYLSYEKFLPFFPKQAMTAPVSGKR